MRTGRDDRRRRATVRMRAEARHTAHSPHAGRDSLHTAQRLSDFVADACRGATQLRWQVLDWNTPAIEVYKRLGAGLDETWINGRLDVVGMHALTQSH